MKEVKKITHDTEQSYEKWIVEQEKELMRTFLLLEEARTEFELKKA